MKTLDLSKTVAQLVKEYPEIKDIMVELGFKDITSPAALMFMGKVMTIPKGATIKGISMERIVAAFEEAGFTVVGLGEDGPAAAEDTEGTAEPEPAEDKNAQLKALIARLNAGEDLESVRADFVREFESVPVDDIVAVEQSLLDEGMPLVEVQRACDLHSALFHGHNVGEACAMGEGSDVPAGHPVDVLRRENRALEQVLSRAEAALATGDAIALATELACLRKVDVLYSKKESILMPMLLHHGITGPNDVMWGVDDEIKAEVARLAGALDAASLPQLADDIAAVLARMREMVYKEENIFFPLCLQNLTDDEWLEAYRDLPEMGNVFADEPPRWQYAELELAVRASLAKAADMPNDGIIRLPGGELTLAQLKALFAVLPIDITFIDENDVNRFFTNEGKVFARPLSALGRSTYECHPERVKPMVKQLLDSFKSGERDTMEVWTPNPEHPVRVLYAAVRDEDGTYLGAAELVEDFTAVRQHFLDEG